MNEYRLELGFSNPLLANVGIEYMSGIGFYILWIDCPDRENIIALNFNSRKQAEKYCELNNFQKTRRVVLKKKTREIKK